MNRQDMTSFGLGVMEAIRRKEESEYIFDSGISFNLERVEVDGQGVHNLVPFLFTVGNQEEKVFKTTEKGGLTIADFRLHGYVRELDEENVDCGIYVRFVDNVTNMVLGRLGGRFKEGGFVLKSKIPIVADKMKEMSLKAEVEIQGGKLTIPKYGFNVLYTTCTKDGVVYPEPDLLNIQKGKYFMMYASYIPNFIPNITNDNEIVADVGIHYDGDNWWHFMKFNLNTYEYEYVYGGLAYNSDYVKYVTEVNGKWVYNGDNYNIYLLLLYTVSGKYSDTSEGYFGGTSYYKDGYTYVFDINYKDENGYIHPKVYRIDTSIRQVPFTVETVNGESTVGRVYLEHIDINFSDSFSIGLIDGSLFVSFIEHNDKFYLQAIKYDISTRKSIINDLFELDTTNMTAKRVNIEEENIANGLPSDWDISKVRIRTIRTPEGIKVHEVTQFDKPSYNYQDVILTQSLYNVLGQSLIRYTDFFANDNTFAGFVGSTHYSIFAHSITVVDGFEGVRI